MHIKDLINTITLTLCFFGYNLHADSFVTLEDYDFIGPSGEVVKAQLGSFRVPENRNSSSDKELTLKYVRLPTTSSYPRAPIVYLSGGPGGSATGTAKGPRFPLFMALREVSDVILFDQRGTGMSNQAPTCETHATVVEQALSHNFYLDQVKENVTECVKFWREQGIDLNGYNTKENAADLVALSDALGVEKVNLWGISYGSHLAFATVKYHPEIIDNMVLASLEGLDHTIKRPARVQALLEKIDQKLKQNPLTSERYPNLLQVMESVLEDVKANPRQVNTINFRTQEAITVGLGELDLQFLLVNVLLRDPEHLVKLPRFFYDMKAGKFEEAAAYIAFMKPQGRYSPMSLAMDAASGISKKRWKKVQKEAKSSLTWRATNLPFPDINHILAVDDLGKDFRKELKSNIRTLFIGGTYDGRTLYSSQRELAKGFKNSSFISVDGAGHNIFMKHPDISKFIYQFFQGEEVLTQTLKLPELVFE